MKRFITSIIIITFVSLAFTGLPSHLIDSTTTVPTPSRVFNNFESYDIEIISLPFDYYKEEEEEETEEVYKDDYLPNTEGTNLIEI